MSPRIPDTHAEAWAMLPWLANGRLPAADREWVQKTIRWVVDWVPESDLTILAALGRIARLTSAGVS